MTRNTRFALLFAVAAAAPACAMNGAPATEEPAPLDPKPAAAPEPIRAVEKVIHTYTVGGSVRGLEGLGLKVQLGQHVVTVERDGAFEIPVDLRDGAPYDVFVAEQPIAPWQDCSINNSEGYIRGAAVRDLEVTCETRTLALIASVKGAAAAIVIRTDYGDEIAVSGDGDVALPTKLKSGSSYHLTVESPETQLCALDKSQGSVAGETVHFNVTCAPREE